MHPTGKKGQILRGRGDAAEGRGTEGRPNEEFVEIVFDSPSSPHSLALKNDDIYLVEAKVE